MDTLSLVHVCAFQLEICFFLLHQTILLSQYSAWKENNLSYLFKVVIILLLGLDVSRICNRFWNFNL